MKNFDWEAFKREPIAVHCGTRGATDEFLDACKEHGIIERSTKHDYYCVFVDQNYKSCLFSTPYNYFINNEYKIIEWIPDTEQLEKTTGLTVTVKLSDLDNIKDVIKVINNHVCVNGLDEYSYDLLKALLGESYQREYSIGERKI